MSKIYLISLFSASRARSRCYGRRRRRNSLGRFERWKTRFFAKCFDPSSSISKNLRNGKIVQNQSQCAPKNSNLRRARPSCAYYCANASLCAYACCSSGNWPNINGYAPGRPFLYFDLPNYSDQNLTSTFFGQTLFRPKLYFDQ